MPRSEDDAAFIARCPTSSFATPQANEPVPIRPLKRLRKEEEEEGDQEASRSPSPVRGELTPRRLDMDQVNAFLVFPAVLFADSCILV